MFIYMYLLFDISSAHSRSLYFSLLLSLSLSLSIGMSFISQRSLVFPLFGYCYCSAYLCHTIFDTLLWNFFQTIYPCLHLSRYVRLYFFDLRRHYYSINLHVWLFLFLSIFYFRCCHLIASLPLSVSFDASPTVSAHVPLSYLYYLFPSLALSLFYFIYSNFLLWFLRISLSHSLLVSLAQPLIILHFIFVTLFLSFFHSR